MRDKLPALNHAPLPYQVRGVDVLDNDNNVIATCEQIQTLDGGNKFETAIFMQLACNAHDGLIEATQDSIAQIEYMFGMLSEADKKFVRPSMTECCLRLNAALDKAEMVKQVKKSGKV